ncbi:hypothetical protein K438DRAFT_1984790 [Mycena galopus ATCC 62051]|nr:hypothetical protein K438DRAFT_1984790 [Mycena galopus ATCC 62051]
MASVDPRFEAADDLSISEISQYRSFFFPPSVCEPTGEIFFSVDNAAEWMISRGYRLFQEHDPTKPPDRSLHPDRVALKDLCGYREQVTGPAYSKNPFFGIERTKEWVLPAPFATYMQATINVDFYADTQERDKDDVEEIHQIVRDGIMRKHWNGPSEREHLSEQRAGWSARQREERNDDLVTYDALAKDREEGQEEWRFSLTRGHALQEQIQLVQAELKLDKQRTYVLPLPPPPPPVQPPDTSAPSDTSGPSRTRRRKRE